METIGTQIEKVIAEYNGEPFLMVSVKKKLHELGINTKPSIIRKEVARLKQKGILKAIGHEGKKKIYQPKNGASKESPPNPPPPLSLENSLTDNVKIIIASLNGAGFCIDEIVARLNEGQLPFKDNSLQALISRDLIRQNVVERVGSKHRKRIYRAVKGIAPPVDPPAPIPPDAKKTDAIQDKKGLSKIKQIRNIILAYHGRPFTVAEVLADLAKSGTAVNKKTDEVRIYRDLRKSGFLYRTTQKRDGQFLYQQIEKTATDAPPAQETTATATVEIKKPAAPVQIENMENKLFPIRPGTIRGAIVACAAGLEKFSAERIAGELKKLHTFGDVSIEKIKTKLWQPMAELKQADCLTRQGPPPFVFVMQPDFYLCNLNNMVAYTDEAPHLELKIMQTFGRHCHPDYMDAAKNADPDQAPPEPKKQAGDTERAPAVETPPETTDDHAKTLGVIAEQQAKINLLTKRIKALNENKLTEKLQVLQDRLDDRNVYIISLQNQLRDADNRVKKLVNQKNRFSQMAEEKERVNAILQRRLNDAMEDIRKLKGKKSSFSFGEMINNPEKIRRFG